jgi:putative hydrolase of the HAD superfamily
MVAALRIVGDRYKTACLTNNIRRAGPSAERSSEIAEIMALFDIVVESSLVGFRKPDPRFYTHACQALEVAPEETVFLDDLGINLKPARAMGIRTIKVTDPERALDELESHLGHSVRE